MLVEITARGQVQLEGREFREGSQVMRQGAQASTGRPGPLVDLRKCRRIGVPANSVSLSSSSLQHWKTAWPKHFNKHSQFTHCVYETICLLVMMATYHIMKALLFFEKRRLTFFIWISYPSFYFLYYILKISVTFCTYKNGFLQFLGSTTYRFWQNQVQAVKTHYQNIKNLK